MSKTFSHTVGYVVYDDTVLTNNPSKQFGNWKRSSYNISVDKPSGPQELWVQPGATVSPFSGTRTLTYTSPQFNLTLNPVKSSTYRLTFNGTGTFSGFRTLRAFSPSPTLPITVTVSVNNNATASLTLSATNSAVQVGDILFIPGTTTGDASSPFNSANLGYWQVVAVYSSTSFSITRLAGETFNGVSETVSCPLGTEIVFFSQGSVLVGDQLQISGGLNPVSFGYKQITAVSWNWVEFVSSTPLPLESNVVMPANSINVFSSAKRWVRIETDSEVILKFNNSTESSLRILPRTAVTGEVIGWFDSWGIFWKLEVVNPSQTTTCKIVVSTVE